jgi:hypothetical protein
MIVSCGKAALKALIQSASEAASLRETNAIGGSWDIYQKHLFWK